MKITKFGHCCLLIETHGVRLLTDPGNYNPLPETDHLDAILISHEHQDHCHLDSIKELLHKNQKAVILTHAGVSKLLKEQGIDSITLSDGEETTLKGVTIQSLGTEHACIHGDLPPVRNTGFLINSCLFYPGDSFHNPGKKINILALPVAGPWMKLSECIEYAKAIKPQAVFPVHDGMLRQEHQLTPTRKIPEMLLEPLGIEFFDMQEGSSQEFSRFVG